MENICRININSTLAHKLKTYMIIDHKYLNILYSPSIRYFGSVNEFFYISHISVCERLETKFIK